MKGGLRGCAAREARRLFLGWVCNLHIDNNCIGDGPVKKIAVTAFDKTPDSAVDERFGRARYIIIFDTESEETQVIDNLDNLNAAQGAGINTAQKMADLSVDLILSGHVGPKAFKVLQATGIQVGTFPADRRQGATCREMLEAWQNGEIAAISNADVKSHWG
ncbi:MAG TPA: dinitrogenase iron-molybdenum cofactor biosynthesis protein [Firmicutes bacterium]|nr:dinitrogenase iron-molybdenum cofactor biosynthesis protein [Bacillota bacterium]HCT37755.1 dinitrogenase iron-molybdenum cofactor biosynthesis protein [Bacillota bacterium]